MLCSVNARTEDLSSSVAASTERCSRAGDGAATLDVADAMHKAACASKTKASRGHALWDMVVLFMTGRSWKIVESGSACRRDRLRSEGVPPQGEGMHNASTRCSSSDVLHGTGRCERISRLLMQVEGQGRHMAVNNQLRYLRGAGATNRVAGCLRRCMKNDAVFVRSNRAG